MNNLPPEIACHACTNKYAGAVCPICKEERPAFTALKNMTRKPVATAAFAPCKYEPRALCGCDGRGTCLEAV